MRQRRSGTVHKPGCKRMTDESLRWKYADDLADEAQLTEVSAQFSWVHLCRYCLAGLCSCKACVKSALAKAREKGESVAPSPSE